MGWTPQVTVAYSLPQPVHLLNSCSIYDAGFPITHLHGGQVGDMVTSTYLTDYYEG